MDGKLNLLDYGDLDENRIEMDVIFVPGPRANRSASKWGQAAKGWQDFTKGAACPWDRSITREHVFFYDIPLETATTWLPLLDAAQCLLELADALHKQSKHTSVLLIGHSLGGIVLKQAIVFGMATRDKYDTLLKQINGIILLGCPHGERTERLQQAVASIVKAAGINCNIAALQRSAAVLAEVSKDFHIAAVGLQRLLSVYEERSTPSNSRIFNRKSILVDEKLALVGEDVNERMAGVAHSHWDICSLEDGEGHPAQYARSQIKALITEAVRAQATAINVPPRKTTLPTVLQKFEAPALHSKLPCYMMDVKARNLDFCGREHNLQQLDSVLLPSELKGTNNHIAIHGAPGQGKTELAAEFVFSRKRHFDAIFWLGADRESKLSQDFASIAHALGIAGTGSIDPENWRKIAKAWLMSASGPASRSDEKPSQSDEKRTRIKWLLVLDNLNDFSILEDYREVFEHGSVLVTSRDPNSTQAISRTQVGIALEPFSEEEAVQALNRLAGRDKRYNFSPEQKELSRQVAQLLGGWPLAIRQMAGIINEKFLSLGEFMRIYNDPTQRGQLHHIVASPSGSSAQITMASVLAKEFITQEASSMLEACSMLDPDGIQDFLFEATRTMDEVPGIPVRGTSTYYDARAELIKLGVIGWNEPGEFWTMHRIIQETVRAQLDPSSIDFTFRFAVSLVRSAWSADGDRLRHQVRSWSHFTKIFSHVRQLENLYLEYRPLGHIKPYKDFAWLLNEAAWWRHEIGSTKSVDSMWILAKETCEALPDAQSHETQDLLSDIFHGLGGLASESNRGSQCFNYSEKQLEMRLRALSLGDKPTHRTAMAYNQRGIGHMMLKQYDQGKADFEASVRYFRDLEDYKPTMDSVPLVNLANTLWLMGDLAEASHLLEEGLRARERKFGGENDREDFKTGRFLHILGNVKYDQAMKETDLSQQAELLGQSDSYHKRALTHYQSTIGLHHRTADVCHRVAEHCVIRKDFALAHGLIDQALNIWNMDAESRTPEIARTTFLKASCTEMSGNSEEAKQLRLRAIKLRSALLPKDRIKDSELQSAHFNELVAFWSR